MTPRRLGLVVLVVVLAAGCAREDLGRATPSCDPNQAGNSLILQAQAIRGLEYVPCINELKAGWEYEHLQARTGLSRFWIDSDRVGTRFLEVMLRPSCDIGGAAQVPSDEGPVPLFMEVERSDYVVSLVVIPEGTGAASRTYALQLGEDFSSVTLRDRIVRVTVDAAQEPTQDRIARALALGSPTIVVGAREEEEGSVELYLPRPGQPTPDPQRIWPNEALHEIEETLGVPRYQATWHYLFEGGCVTYRFDARGPGIATLPAEVQEALGLYPLGPLRAVGEQFGWVLP